MNLIVQILAVVEALILVGVGVLEAFHFRNQRFYPILLIKPEDTAAVRLWTVNVGFYNIVSGLGIILGISLINLSDVTVGKTLVIYVCAMHVLLGLVLGISEPRLKRSALAQSLFPLLIILLAMTL